MDIIITDEWAWERERFYSLFGEKQKDREGDRIIFARAPWALSEHLLLVFVKALDVIHKARKVCITAAQFNLLNE